MSFKEDVSYYHKYFSFFCQSKQTSWHCIDALYLGIVEKFQKYGVYTKDIQCLKKPTKIEVDEP